MDVENIEIGKELRNLNYTIKRYIDRQTNKEEIDRLTGTNGWIIGYISHNRDREIFQKDLEKEFGITRSTASKVIDLMVQKGFIEKKSVERDARLKKLVLTQKAEKIENRIRKGAAETENVLRKGFSDDEIRALYGFIERIKANILKEEDANDN